MQTIYIARHATPDLTRDDLVYHLPPGPPLTEKGKAEARQMAAFFNEKNVAVIWTSLLERCLQTARIAGSLANIPFFVRQGLAEWKPDEKTDSVINRLLPVFEEAAQLSAPLGPVALITHGGPIASLLSELGMAEPKLEEYKIFDNRNPAPPAGIWCAARRNETDDWQLSLIFCPKRVNIDKGKPPEKD